ncbi:MAG: type II secretion system F family protein [Candidatus Diapherotrites archaeon]|nr:type II secretion system F family protein [Candidatus Diapherotrites archaeon]
MNPELVPFNPFPVKLLKKIAPNFFGIGRIVTLMFPALKLELRQANLAFDEKEYSAIVLIVSFSYFVFFSIFGALIASKFLPEQFIQAGLGAGALFAVMMFSQIVFYPNILVKKKTRDVERNLVFALRTMLVQLKSGVTLFDSLTVVAEGDYGQLTHEFKAVINKINSGKIETYALSEMAEENPSYFFRRSIDQIVNGLKAGAEITSVLSEIVDSMVKEQGLQIQGYGSQMKLLSLVYMMLGVIIPALGITFLIVIGSFPQVKITEIVFWALLGFIVISQFMYLGIMKSKRPNLISD